MKRITVWMSALAIAGTLAACDEATEATDGTADGGSTETDAGTEGSGTPEEDASTADTAAPIDCVYPTPEGVGYDRVIPDIVWESAYNGAGEDVGFDLYDFHCSPEYDAYDTLVVVVSAGWCQFCPDMITWVDALSERLEQEGAMILFLEAQDAQQAPIGSAAANQHFSQYAPNGSGIRVGDNDGTPANTVANSPLLQAFPTTFVVRRSDMRIITDSSRSDYILPFVEIAMDPDADWSSPPPPEIVPEFPSNCGPEDEESSEPANNGIEGAQVIDAPTTFDGGICDANPDFYNVQIEGDWTFTVNFTHAEGDLDIYLWNPETEQPIEDAEGNVIGSDSVDDNESFSSSGPGYVFVYGYQNATATYSIEVTTP